MTDDKSLQHIGVLGMRWGHRTSSGTTTVRGKPTTKLTTVRGKPIVKQEHVRTSLKVTKKLLATAIIAIGSYSIGSAVQRRSGAQKFAAAQKRGSQQVKKILADSRAGNRVLDASFTALKAQYPRMF